MTVAREPTLAVENGAAPPHRQPTGVRASDRERQDVVDRLHCSLGEGRLDLDETDARVSAAYASRTMKTWYPSSPTSRPTTRSRTVGRRMRRLSGRRSCGGCKCWCGVWGADGRAAVRPTAAQCRMAVAFTVWIGACAVLGAALLAG